MASTIMAATTSRVVAAKTPFLGQGRTAGNATPLRDVTAAAGGRITMVRSSLALPRPRKPPLAYLQHHQSVTSLSFEAQL
jgi:hypothetical protein